MWSHETIKSNEMKIFRIFDFAEAKKKRKKKKKKCGSSRIFHIWEICSYSILLPLLLLLLLNIITLIQYYYNTRIKFGQ